MRTTFEFSPLFRSSIGFDRMLNALEAASRVEPLRSWPPCDIVRTGEDDYRIDMAVAGFGQDDLTVTQEQNVLVVTGRTADEDEGAPPAGGLARRDFQRRFELADHVTVTGARLHNGMLTIDLTRELPEEKKPRRIEIGAGTALPGPEKKKQIESRKQAA